ncbi:unnamed protein product [Mytilus coruscus]|uniref:Uncharacterized protein n=1 Tax=Mytilus coruscus TaxID=42192 RepID=A0A6J8B6J3_MYTCO|nr:unnamed protein product [Mytilus coruscus]
MASRLSQEEENYVRMSLLLTGISPRAARALFDHEFAPSCLDSSLKKEYNKLKDLQKKRVINQSQWNLLFPRFPDVPDSKTFDVTLIITLLRNLTDLTPPHGGFDHLPSDNETTPTSDLARIKYYRNDLAHRDEGKVDSTTFTTAWDNITNAISRLGGQPMKQECDNLKVKILDQTNQEIMLDIKRSNSEIMELKMSVESLKKANEDMKIEVKKLKTSQEDTVPWNIRAQISQILVEWKDNDQMFITTEATKHVLKCIKEKSCVTITASSGVGKTAILRHVALQMAKEGYDLLLVTDPGDIVKFYNPNQKTLFVIDDLCGNYSLNQTDIKVWEPVMERIKKILSNTHAKIIAACRLQVYQDDKFESLSVFKSCVCNLLSDNMCLSKAEKESLAEVYLKTKAPEIIDYYDLYDCFPLLCKLYHENPALNITDFFQNPFTVYEAETDKLQKKGFSSKYCALALCVMFNNKLKEEILTDEVNEETRTIIENTCEACRLDRGTSRLTLQDELNSLTHTFLKKEQNIYKTIHDKIFDFLVFYFGQKIIHCLIKNAHRGLIKERFLLEKQNNVDQFITIVPPRYHEMYIQRMIDDWSKGEVNDVFCNLNMKIPQFRKKILCFLNELDVSYQRQLVHTCDVGNNDTVLLWLCAKGDIPMIYWCINHGVDVNQCRNDKTEPLMDGWSPVMIACRQGHTEIVRMLIDTGADYNKCNNYGWSPVTFACGKGHTEIVRMLLDIGTDYNKCDSEGCSPVMIACRYGRTEIVRMLLDIGADYNKCDNEGWSPVMSACRHGHTEIVRMLLDIGADYDKCDDNGWSPVMYACREGHTEIVRMLLDIGADYNKCDNDKGWSPVKNACSEGHTEIVRMLLDIGADYDKCDNNGCSPVMYACREGHTEIVRMLIDKGADYNKCDNNGWSPVMYACREGHTEIVRMLLDKGADYNNCNNGGWSPVKHACNNGHTEIVRMLLDIGADYNKCDNDKGWSPVKNACSEGHTEIVRMLLDIGADYDKCDNEGWSPVKSACSKGHTEIVRMLLDIGADFNKCNNNGWSPIKSACNEGHTEIVKMLLDIGADYNKCDNDGWSPVKNACNEGHTEIVRILLDIGADYNNCDNDGWSPVKSACSKGQTEIVRMLLDIGADCNKCDNNGWSPVMHACTERRTEIVRMLLDIGADYNKCDNNGCSPVMYTCCKGHSEIVRMLLDIGADYNKCDNDGCSPVMCACSEGYGEIVRMLLDKGADYNKCNNGGCSPIMYACDKGHTEIVRMLLDIGADYNNCNMEGKSTVIIASEGGYSDIVNVINEHSRNKTELNDDDLDVVLGETIQECPLCGENMLKHMLIAKGIRVQRWRLRDSIQRLDSSGAQKGNREDYTDEVYNVMGANHLWHIDTYHKLVRWRLLIIGGVDGFSRMTMFLKCCDNNMSQTVLNCFCQVSPTGVPLRVRSTRDWKTCQLQTLCSVKVVMEVC